MLEIVAYAEAVDTNIQVAGAVVGSLLGAIVGAVSTYLLSERARKKQKEQDDINATRREIRASTGAMVAIEDSLHNLLVMALKNRGHFSDMSKGIYDSNNNRTIFTLSLPKPYGIVSNLENELFNVDLVVQWQALELEVVLHNANITELIEYYSALRGGIRAVQMTSPESLNVDPIVSDSKVIATAAKGQVEACDNFIGRCIEVLARIQLYMKVHKKVDYSKVSYSDIKDYKQKLIDYKPTVKALEAKKKELSEQYTEENAFSVNEHYQGSD